MTMTHESRVARHTSPVADCKLLSARMAATPPSLELDARWTLLLQKVTPRVRPQGYSTLVY